MGCMPSMGGLTVACIIVRTTSEEDDDADDGMMMRMCDEHRQKSPIAAKALCFGMIVGKDTGARTNPEKSNRRSSGKGGRSRR